MTDETVSRRGMFGAAALAGAALATGDGAHAASSLPAHWDREADVVVIGSGAAGLPAAIAAREGGASVILIEAERDIGGHAICSGEIGRAHV